MTRHYMAVLTLLLAAPLARADGDYFSPTDERFRLSLGAMHVSSNTNIRVDSSAGVSGTNINGEDNFGLDHSDFEPKFQVVLRVATRHRLSFDYFTLDRTGNTTLANDTRFGNVVLPASTPESQNPLQTKLSLRTFGITYEYSVWHSEKLEIAATLGVHETDISSEARVETPDLHIIERDDQAGPIPTVGLDATWVISKRFYLDGRGQYLNLHVNHLDGSLGLYTLDALYRYRPNVAFGVGYTEVRAHISSTQGAHAGNFDFNTKGPEMFFRVGF